MPLTNKLASVWKARPLWKSAAKSLTPSVSQYAEDMIIARLLRPGDEGTYVDVGANHPFMGSNTYRLYLQGWRGLTIDPNPAFASEFAQMRPRDKHLTIGVSRSARSLTYYEYESNSANTMSRERADQMRAEGTLPLRETIVPCEPLATIVERELPSTHIDLLNVDVEGMDVEVLESLDLTRHRPTALIVEDFHYYASVMNGTEPTAFERFLRGHDYLPIAQSAWSSIFVARDWETLIARSRAFDRAKLQNSYMPGQFEALPWVGKAIAG